jgi:hypothetical protein
VTVSVLERVLGKSDLISVTFLESAVRAAKTVARIRIRSDQRTVGYGTGSLVAPNVLMTNNHVLGSAAEAATSLAEFNYQDGIQTPTVFELDPGSLFVTDPTLDYTLVAVRSHGTGPSEVKSFGFNRLIEQQGRILIGEALNIIQHPNGELKQVALRENQLKDILPKFLHYHLSACESGCNSFRGDIPYFDFPDFEEVVRNECGKRDANRLEPSAAKGVVARATLYFFLCYPGNISTSYDTKRLTALLSWHESHPVTEYERHRNMAFFAAQGNRKPLIDHAEWASEIDFRSGL